MATYFTVKGVRYERPHPDDWTFAEGHEFQRISGMPVGRGVMALIEGNSDGILGMLVVSMQRTNPNITEHDLAGEKLGEIIGSFEEIEPEVEAEPNPPTAPPSNGGGSGADTSALPPTPAAFGIPPG